MFSEQEFLGAIESNQKIIHKVCTLYGDTAEDRKDLFQEILLNAWKGSRSFKGDSKFSTWLYRVALNTAITFFRKDNRQVQTVPLTESASEFFSFAEEEKKDQLASMYQAISLLSPIDKALVMLYLEDYSYQEIAEIMGITINNVAVKMNRIKTKLKEGTKKNS